MPTCIKHSYLLPIFRALSHSPGTEHFPFVLSYLENKEIPQVTCQYDLCELGKNLSNVMPCGSIKPIKDAS